MNVEEADVIIIGTGQAGVPLASRLAALGKRVLIAERSAFGGTCENTGCMPTKTLVGARACGETSRCSRQAATEESAWYELK